MWHCVKWGEMKVSDLYSPITHQCGPPRGDWLGPRSQADLQSPGNDSSVYILFNLFLRLFTDGADTVSSSNPYGTVIYGT